MTIDACANTQMRYPHLEGEFVILVAGIFALALVLLPIARLLPPSVGVPLDFAPLILFLLVIAIYCYRSWR